MEVSKIDINVHQLTRVEGHGNIIVRVHHGKVEEVRWEITESPRFLEVILRGRHWEDVHVIASRICGICSVSHQFASLQATEAAFGVELSEQTILLRKLLFDAETLQSHVLHDYFLIAPDFFGVGSVFPLVETHPDIVLRALRLKKFANDWADLLCGRKTHPLSYVAGGAAGSVERPHRRT